MEQNMKEIATRAKPTTRTITPSSSDQNSDSNPRKRKSSSSTAAASCGSSSNTSDSLGRIRSSTTSLTTTGGRGALVGWTTCPLCGEYSSKKFALGRGIAAHLRAAHTPWNPPGKVERRKRRRLTNRRMMNSGPAADINSDTSITPTATTTATTTTDDGWEPTEQEREDWDAQVLKLIQELEEQHSNNNNVNTPTMVDRTGQPISSYRDSLPPFLEAAANGNLKVLQDMVEKAAPKVGELLNARDRHLSTAEHWAAGNGHLQCLKFLFQQQEHLGKMLASKEDNQSNKENKTNSKSTAEPEEAASLDKVIEQKQPNLNNNGSKKIRRRDGKTCLHYAARNGRLSCVQYLVEECGYDVNEHSGDGTTPFHLSCFGAHLETSRYLVQQGANPHHPNDWGCTAVHWIGMATKDSGRHKNIVQFCEFLRAECGVDFSVRQTQGHTILHKAAQHKNYEVLEWLLKTTTKTFSPQQKALLGAPDVGGHKPSDILVAVGGDAEWAQRIRQNEGW